MLQVTECLAPAANPSHFISRMFIIAWWFDSCFRRSSLQINWRRVWAWKCCKIYSKLVKKILAESFFWASNAKNCGLLCFVDKKSNHLVITERGDVKKKSLHNVGQTPSAFLSTYITSFLCMCCVHTPVLCRVVECYAVLHLPVVEMEGDMAGCSLSEEGEC